MPKLATSILISLLAVFLFPPILGDEDCTYTMYNYSRNSANSRIFEPCKDTEERVHVRSIKCTRGNVIHICCRLPCTDCNSKTSVFIDRSDVQMDRQHVFRMVTLVGNILSRECTKRILCEESCRDGLRGKARYDNPQVMSDDTQANKEYVAAFSTGEALSCYGKSTEPYQYSEGSCKQDCQLKFPECDEHMNRSFVARSYYMISHIFHMLGMWSFSASWLIRDDLHKCASSLIQCGPVIKEGARLLKDRMEELIRAYISWKKEIDQQCRGRRSPREEWKQFLRIFNATDPALVEHVYEMLDYPQFSNNLKVINETLYTYDFCQSSWMNSGSSSPFKITLLFVGIQILLLKMQCLKIQ